MNFDFIGVAAVIIAAAGYLGWRVYTVVFRKRGQSSCPGCGTCDAANAAAPAIETQKSPEAQKSTTNDTKSTKALN
jgi:hypothetical protein